MDLKDHDFNLKLALVCVVVVLIGIAICFGMSFKRLNTKVDAGMELLLDHNVTLYNKLVYLQENSITDKTKQRLTTYLHLRYTDYEDQIFEAQLNGLVYHEEYLKGKLEQVADTLKIFCGLTRIKKY